MAPWRRTTRADTGYGAFLSYSGDRDRALLPAVQNAIEKLPRPWYRPPRMRIFLDYSGISIGPELRGKIVAGLSRSKWLVVIASPEAAQSKWVDREIEWWLANRSPETILLVLSAGSLAWDERAGDWDRARSTALPPRLFGVYASEPVYKTIKWHTDSDGVARPDIAAIAVGIAAVVRGVSEADLKSEGYQETKRNLRWAKTTIAALVVLLVSALIAAFVARVQSSRAEEQARIATARLMASVADTESTTDVRAALLLAVAAYRLDPSPRHHAALLRANLASPAVARHVAVPASVTALESSADGATIVAGLADGQVVTWAPGGAAPTSVARLPGAIRSVAVAADGRTVLATDGVSTTLWRDGAGRRDIGSPAERGADVVAVSASGKLGAVHRLHTDAAGTSSGAVDIIDISSGNLRASHPAGPGMKSMVFTADTVLRLLDPIGGVRQVSLGDGATVDLSPVDTDYACGTSQNVGNLSADGSSFVCSVLPGLPVPVFRLRKAPDDPRPETRYVGVPKPRGTAPAALSRTARVAAVPSEDGGLYVAPVTDEITPREPPPLITGSAVDFDRALLRFRGASETQLVSASGSLITLWDIEQRDRLAKSIPVPIVKGCNSCPPSLSLSPDGRTAVITGKYKDPDEFPLNGDVVIIQQLGPDSSRRHVIPGLDGMPVWRPDGTLLAIAANPDSGYDRRVSADRPRTEMPFEVAVLSSPPPQVQVRAAAVPESSGTAVSLDGSGRAYLHNLATGGIDSEFIPLGGAVDSSKIWEAAIDANGEMLVMRDDDHVSVLDLSGQQHTRDMDGKDVRAMAFAGRHLLIGREENIEIWDRTGSRRERTIPFHSTRGATAQVTSAEDASVVIARDQANYMTLFAADGTNLGELKPDAVWHVTPAVALSADGRYLVTMNPGPAFSGGVDGTLIERDISPAGLIHAACAHAGADLTDSEWDALIGIARPAQARCPQDAPEYR
ncbi:TIR domain-containing protein [Nocardia arthritidis]|uniref:TIR domain-containing protein n=1 Tax=Nocardia arthritidis TaxID=228602 RepID=UPI0007A54F5E|nr:TIR domain-containing protein [Nocardia arthritidis]